jgi:hypothetical protein
LRQKSEPLHGFSWAGLCAVAYAEASNLERQQNEQATVQEMGGSHGLVWRSGQRLAQPVNRLRIGLIGRFELGVKDLQTELRAAQTAGRDSALLGSAHTPRTNPAHASPIAAEDMMP